MDETAEGQLSRRRVLALSAGAVATAGCLGGSNTQPAGGPGGASTTTPTEPAETPTKREPPAGTDGPLGPPVAGDPDADVVVEEYTDYGCPYCARYAVDGFPQLESSYIADGTIRYEHRDLPLPHFEPGSWVAASAAREVQALYGVDAFYSYARTLFANQEGLRSNPGAHCEQLASELGLDAAAIRDAGVNRVHDEAVRRDRQRGIQLGVQGTPTFVINGEVFTAGFRDGTTIDQLSSGIEERL